MNAIQQLLTDQLDIWTAAEAVKKSGRGRSSGNGVSVYGIKKLRELILELAVRGKLVPQDPNDEPVSELLKRIQAEKAKLNAEGKIKKGKVLPPITEEEKPFELPEGWQWVRQGGIGNIFNGNSINASKKDAKYVGASGLPYIATKDVGYGFDPLDYKNGICIPLDEEKFRIAHEGAVLICAEGGSAGKKCGLTDRDICFGNKLFANELYSKISPRYMLYAYLSPVFRASFVAAMTGIIGGVSIAKFVEIAIPLPSLQEQHRIVAKVDELMALCDQLETQHNNAAAAHEKLVSYLLGTLTQMQSADDFSANWQRIAAHFGTLFTTESSIDALKQTLLQLAVMGKLVPQDLNDEPASELLKRCGISSTASFVSGWSKVSLGALGDIYSGATPSKAKPEYWVGNIPWVSPKNMKRHYINDAEDNVSNAAVNETNLKLIPTGSILLVVRGMILAHSFPVALTTSEVTINQDMKALVVPREIKEFMLLYLRAMKNSFVALVDRSSHGTCKLVSEKLWAFMVECPPHAEQIRIVTKVDELMALCDQLKIRITEANQLQQKIADGVVEQAVSQ